MKKKKQYIKPKQQRRKFFGNLHIKASFKNTILFLTTKKGKLIKQISTKSLKKTTYKKNTPYNIQIIVEKLNNIIKLKRILKLNVTIQGKGYGKRHVLKNLSREIKVPYVFYKIPTPFNGCRKKKKKRR